MKNNILNRDEIPMDTQITMIGDVIPKIKAQNLLTFKSKYLNNKEFSNLQNLDEAELHREKLINRS